MILKNDKIRKNCIKNQKLQRFSKFVNSGNIKISILKNFEILKFYGIIQKIGKFQKLKYSKFEKILFLRKFGIFQNLKKSKYENFEIREISMKYSKNRKLSKTNLKYGIFKIQIIQYLKISKI